MKLTTKLFAAAFALSAATGAFAASDDGNSDNAWLQQATAHLQVAAPAPAPAAAPSDTNAQHVNPVIDSNNQIVIP